jgi:hypothetical protein
MEVQLFGGAPFEKSSKVRVVAALPMAATPVQARHAQSKARLVFMVINPTWRTGEVKLSF